MTPDRIDALASELFAAARDERPDRRLVERVERATEAQAPVPLAGSLPPAPSWGPLRPEPEPEPLRARVRRPWLVRALLAAIVCGGVAAFWLLPRAHDGVIMSAERAPSAPVTPPTRGREPATLPEPAASDEDSARSEPSPSPLPPSAREGAAPAPSSAPRSSVASPRTATRLPAPESEPSHRNAGAPDDVAGDERAPARASTLANELGVLKQIRQALRQHEGGAALALLDRYDSGEYGTSLALEARVLRVEALDASGRRPAALALARRFVRENPDSPLAERTQRFLDTLEPARSSAEPASP